VMVHGGPLTSRSCLTESTHHLQLAWWVDKRKIQGLREIRGDPCQVRSVCYGTE
jgi:hypothetical protein